nr:MAG TPA_asm: hypothetical protein [Caudoviricetes sp.]
MPYNVALRLPFRTFNTSLRDRHYVLVSNGEVAVSMSA